MHIIGVHVSLCYSSSMHALILCSAAHAADSTRQVCGN
jgi:hypothetical protein